MKKYLTVHLSLLVTFFVLMTLTKGWLDIRYLPFWVGGLVGFFLPDLDYAIHHYFLRNNTNPSVDTVMSDVTSKNVIGNWMASANNREGKKLIFHTAHFQLIFILFAYFVLSSSGSLLGRGIVLAFMLHLLVDLLMDWKYKGNIDRWFEKIPYHLDTKQKTYFIYGNIAILLVFGFVF